MNTDEEILYKLWDANSVSPYPVGQRVGSSKLDVGSRLVRGTVIGHAAMGYGMSLVDWDDGNYPAQAWRADELRVLSADEQDVLTTENIKALSEGKG